jgi:two-component system, LuxR family, response regulator FixJ
MSGGLVHIVDDDALVRETTADVLADAGYAIRTYGSGDDFLAQADLSMPSCVVLDLRMPGLSGEDVLAALAAQQAPFGVVIVSGHANIPIAVRAMQAGAVNVIQKPWKPEVLLEAVADALARVAAAADRTRAAALIAALTPRERNIIEALAAHGSNPRAAAALGLSVRTVDWHRANVKKRLGAASTADMLRLYFEATRSE